MREWTREEYAEFNKDVRKDLYFKAAIWAGIGGIGPIGFFLNHNVLNTPQPVSRVFTGFHHDSFPTGDSYETYNYDFATTGDHALNILGFVLGIFVAFAVAGLFYCLARFVADPIMYRIDLRTEHDSPQQNWPKRLIMFLVVLLYCGSMVFAGECNFYPERDYIWLSDGNGNEYRVNREEYEKYMKDSSVDRDKESKPAKETTAEPTTKATEPEEPYRTPIERGYPSNDLEYYIDHPNEPMPQELAEEIMAPDHYNPGMDYNGYPPY